MAKIDQATSFENTTIQEYTKIHEVIRTQNEIELRVKVKLSFYD